MELDHIELKLKFNVMLFALLYASHKTALCCVVYTTTSSDGLTPSVCCSIYKDGFICKVADNSLKGMRRL